MKILYPDKLISVSANEANANYPVTNLTDGHLKTLWKATSRDAILTISAGPYASGLALFNTNATSAQVVVEAIGGEAQEDDTYDLTTSEEGCFDAYYNSRGVTHEIVITLSSLAGTTLEAGQLAVGTVETFIDPEYGLQEGMVDNSIVKKLLSGGFYTKKRNVARQFSGRITEDRDTDFYTFMRDFAKVQRTDPFACRLSTNITAWDWVVFVRLDGMPKGAHPYYEHSTIDINLLEAL